MLRPDDPGYPAALCDLGGRPRRLRLLGDPSILHRPRLLAIVGTRSPSPATIELTREITSRAVALGWAVVSGLSPGVDTEAHVRALEMGGVCLAVPGCGLGTLLEGSRSALARQVAARGLLVSVSPHGAPESPARRWWRNRVIAALSRTLVVTASETEGGAWEAARWARRLGRPVPAPDPAQIAAVLGRARRRQSN